MRKTANLISFFMIGFLGVALIMDEPEMLIVKSKIAFFGFLMSTILHAIEEFK